MFYSRQRPKIYPQNIDEESTTQKCPLGTEWPIVDGTVYRYMQAGASGLITPGQPICAPAQGSFASMMLGIGASALANTLYLFNSNAALSITLNQFADGWLGTSDGRTYKIKSNPAVSVISYGLFYLHDTIVSALASTASYCLIQNTFAGVQSTVVAAGMSTAIVGVIKTSVTSLCYFWGVTKSPCVNVLLDTGALLVSGQTFTLGSGGVGFGAKTSCTTAALSQATYGVAIKNSDESLHCMVALGVTIACP
jgi:hypothetical protein